mmetsp:Transcript_20931/g.71311  ORF Transcript_20931/g.71311 Transcript_20931/m.71311 type:complete len:205 (-) Transcript_20931:3144-3758(-)
MSRTPSTSYTLSSPAKDVISALSKTTRSPLTPPINGRPVRFRSLSHCVTFTPPPISCKDDRLARLSSLGKSVSVKEPPTYFSSVRLASESTLMRSSSKSSWTSVTSCSSFTVSFAQFFSRKLPLTLLTSRRASIEASSALLAIVRLPVTTVSWETLSFGSLALFVTLMSPPTKARVLMSSVTRFGLFDTLRLPAMVATLVRLAL